MIVLSNKALLFEELMIVPTNKALLFEELMIVLTNTVLLLEQLMIVLTNKALLFEEPISWWIGKVNYCILISDLTNKYYTDSISRIDKCYQIK